MMAGLVAQTANADAQYPQLTNLPTVYINTENNAPILDKENYVKANVVYVDGENVTKYEDYAAGVRGRGNSTWGLAKKPYRLKFDKKQEFLGSDHAKAKNWTFLANYADKALIRNAVAACIGEFAGQPFTASAQFVDLVLNGQYLGNYQISDQMEVNKKRVNVTEQEFPLPADANITGGYFLEVDGFADQEISWFRTSKGVKITIKSPKDDEINRSQAEYIEDYYNQFEEVLFSDEFDDPEKGYRPWIDPETLASWYISTELSANPDGFWSTYMYKEQDDPKLYWGPLWDYDIAFNNCNRVGDVTNALMLDRGFGSDLSKVWVKRMWEDPWFAELINNKWKELVAKGIEQHVIDYIDKMAKDMEQSAKKNFSKWPINQHVYNELVLFDTYTETIDFLKKFVHEHCAYLTRAFKDKAENMDIDTPSPVFVHDANWTYRFINKGTGKTATYDKDKKLCIKLENPDDYTQEWVLQPEGEYFRIVNHSSGLAITDVTAKQGPNYNAGTQLEVADVDAQSDRQLWKIKEISTNKSYVIENKETKLAWNNSGGGTADGTPILAYTNDNQNENKPNRQWHTMTTTPIKPVNVIEETLVPDYYVAYRPEVHTLVFATESGEAPVGELNIYDVAGNTLLSTAIATETSLEAFTGKGVVIVSWTINGKVRSVKVTL